MGQKVIIRFWWKSGLSSASRNHLTTFCRPFVPRAYARGLGWVQSPHGFDMLQKPYLHKGDYLFSHSFCLLICHLNANTTEWICMQFSRNIVNAPKSNN